MAGMVKMMAMAGVMAGALVASAAGATGTSTSVTNLKIGTGISVDGNQVPSNPSILIDFNGASTNYGQGFSLSGGALTTGSANGYSQPTGDFTQYLMVNAQQTANLTTKDNTYSGFGLYWGSIDSFNKLEVLNAAGNVIETILGSNVVNPGADAAGSNYNDFKYNRYVTYTLDQLSGERISGLRFFSDKTAFELDNVSFFGGKPTSVPEPATLTLFGAGIAGMAAASRRRRKKTA